MDPLLEQFLVESREFLQEIGEKLLELESNPTDKDLINELFRLVHTLKGNSGLFDFTDMTKVLHASEDLLDNIREGKITYSTELADLLLDTMDFVSMLCDEIEAEGTIKNNYSEKATQLSKALRDSLGTVCDDANSKQEALREDFIGSISIEQLSCLTEDLQANIVKLLQEGNPVYHVSYTPAADCFYHGDDPFYLVRQTPELIHCSIETKEEWPELVALDAYRCNLVFKIISACPIEELTEHFRYVMDCIDIAEIKIDTDMDKDELVESATHSTFRLSPLEERVLHEILSAQRSILTLESNVDWFEGRLKAVAKALGSCCMHIGDAELLGKFHESMNMAIENKSPIPLLEWLDNHMMPYCQKVMQHTSGCKEDDRRKSQKQDEESLSTATDETGDRNRSASRYREENLKSKVLKVDQSKIDSLMSLVGEMVVAKNALPYLASKAEKVYGARNLGHEIKVYYTTISRIVEEMQDTVMQVRMVPIATVFRKFPRLVRDIAHKLGKEVELVIEGEDTEADKNIIEALADPLIHIIRNSLDHGIELPQERVKMGKPQKGRLVIKAIQESDRVIIEISDDGRGIDPKKIKLKAYEKGIIDETALEELSDREAVNLIMTPGFSTAETVSDLSGRGVGMDVVRNMVEKVKGELKIVSEPCKGTKIVLSLPLSMAVTNVMIVISDGRKFGVPMDMVVETVRLSEQDVVEIKDKRATVLRNNLIPLFNLNELLHLDSPQKLTDDNELAVLVVRTNLGSVGIVVDEFCGTTDIILKPMDGILSGINVYAGTALLGDGSVLMVLNPKELLRWQ